MIGAEDGIGFLAIALCEIGLLRINGWERRLLIIARWVMRLLNISRWDVKILTVGGSGAWLLAVNRRKAGLLIADVWNTGHLTISGCNIGVLCVIRYTIKLLTEIGRKIALMIGAGGKVEDWFTVQEVSLERASIGLDIELGSSSVRLDSRPLAIASLAESDAPLNLTLRLLVLLRRAEVPHRSVLVGLNLSREKFLVIKECVVGCTTTRELALLGKLSEWFVLLDMMLAAT